ncbi:MAG: transposase [Candidatus Rokubacteria bacterium]|nr:transposase [Candidatus Rokubacteria bacterium]
MELGLKRTRNAVYQTAYHAVWIPKYRKKVLVGAIAPSLAIQWFKGIAARTLFAEFPTLRTQLRRGHMWAPSFYIGTAGSVSAETIRRYIERTEPIRARR